MKTLKIVILTFSLLLFASVLVKANPSSKAERTIEYVLNRYIESITEGKTYHFSTLLDNTFKQCISYSGNNIFYNKKQIVDYMNKTKNLIRNCSTTYSIVENNKNFSIAKVEMKYPSFTKIDYLTMNSKGTGWTITNVFTTYK